MFVLTRRTLRDEAATARYRVYDKKKIKKDDRIFWLLNVKLAGAKEMVRKTRRSFVLFFLCVFFLGSVFRILNVSDYGDL